LDLTIYRFRRNRRCKRRLEANAGDVFTAGNWNPKEPLHDVVVNASNILDYLRVVVKV
jgi:hypothetical protein